MAVDPRLDPIPEFRAADKIGVDVRCHEGQRRLPSEGYGIAEGDIRQREKQSAMGRAPRVDVLVGDAKSDDDVDALVAVIKRLQRLQKLVRNSGAKPAGISATAASAGRERGQNEVGDASARRQTHLYEALGMTSRQCPEDRAADRPHVGIDIESHGARQRRAGPYGLTAGVRLSMTRERAASPA